MSGCAGRHWNVRGAKGWCSRTTRWRGSERNESAEVSEELVDLPLAESVAVAERRSAGDARGGGWQSLKQTPPAVTRETTNKARRLQC